MTTTAALEYLETYLQDHRAGAEFGADLARRMADENAGSRYEDFLLRTAQEIEHDVETLEGVMEAFGVDRSLLKTAGAKIGEKVARLKANNELGDYSPLSRLLEFEGLRGGVEAKLSLWDSLIEVAPHDERIDGELIVQMVARAEAQLSSLREHQRIAARDAFVTPA